MPRQKNFPHTIEVEYLDEQQLQKNKTNYYKNIESSLDLSPFELMVGMNIAAYTSKHFGDFFFREIEPVLKFVSYFNVRANNKSGYIDVQKVYNSMPKIHQLMLNEYVFGSYENIVDNCEKESEYVLENISRFKASFYISIKDLMKDYYLDPVDAFIRYTNELGVEMPDEPKFDINEFIEKEKTLIKNGFGNPDFYSRSFKLLDAYVKINEQDKILAEQDKILAEKDKILAEKDKILAEQDRNLLNNALAFGVEHYIDENDIDLLRLFRKIKDSNPTLNGKDYKITKEIYNKYT
jgi:hypothetical protein